MSHNLIILQPENRVKTGQILEEIHNVDAISQSRKGGFNLHQNIMSNGAKSLCAIDTVINDILLSYQTSGRPVIPKSIALSCISITDLQNMYKNITAENEEKIRRMSAKQLWKSLNEKLYKELSECNISRPDERIKCWLTRSKLRNTALAKRILSERFKPMPPEHSQGWLSNFDISDVMKQVQKVYTDYIFIGPVSVDYDEYLSELLYFSLRDIVEKQGKVRIGIIWNLDLHTGPGTHWVALYIEISNNDGRKCSIEYYNSVGREPPEKIKQFMGQVENMAKELYPSIEVIKRWNHKTHQRENSECGVFSINFILSRLNGMTFDEIERQTTFNDRQMQQYRKFLFR